MLDISNASTDAVALVPGPIRLIIVHRREEYLLPNMTWTTSAE